MTHDPAPKITDRPPEHVVAELAALRDALDAAIPAKQLDRNVLIATWNLRSFGGLTEKWESEDSDSPRRDLRSLLAIAEVVRHFDVIAIQEVKGDLKALRHLLKALGRDWGLILTDVNEGDAGNSERMAYLFDRRTVRLSGLAAEVTIPDDYTEQVTPASYRRQFARSPYAVSFQAGETTFILVTLHVLYGKQAEDRVPELEAIARWLSDWSKQVNSWHHSLIALGDFNIDRREDACWQAFTSTGLTPPEALNDAPRSIFDDPDKPSTWKFYDQIAWFLDRYGQPRLSMDLRQAGTFDFVPHVQPEVSRASLSWRISDHLPLWVEMGLRR